YHTDVVEQLYQTYLHRPVDASGLAGYVAFLDHGGTVAQLRAMLLGSEEYYFGRGGGTNDGFLASLYQDALGRSIDRSGLATYGQMLASGVSRSDIALALLHSAEGSMYRVDQDYQWLFHRATDQSGLSAYSDFLAQGGRKKAVIRMLLSSDNFFGHSKSNSIRPAAVRERWDPRSLTAAALTMISRRIARPAA